MFRVSVSATVTGLAFVGVACVLFPNLTSAASASAGAPHAAVAANDNRTPSGRMEDGTLNVALRAGRGTWQPEGTDGPRLAIEAFGEGASPLMVPAPLIRAVAGTTIDVSVRNDVDGTLQVHGLCARSGTRCGPLSVSPGETGVVRFRIDQPGTYHYWATTIGAPVHLLSTRQARLPAPIAFW